MTVPIDLAPAPRSRRVAVRVQIVLAGAIVAAVIVQIYLIGAYIFGAGQGALDAHRAVGFATHAVELLVLISSLIAGRDRLPALALAVLGTVQLALAGGHRWVGGLHPLFAMVVLALAGTIVTRAWKAR